MPKYRFSINRGSQYILHIQVDILSKEIFIFRCIKRFYLNYRFCRYLHFFYTFHIRFIGYYQIPLHSIVRELLHIFSQLITKTFSMD